MPFPSSWTVRISGFAKSTSASLITMGLRFLFVNEPELLARLTLFEACNFVILDSVCCTSYHTRHKSRIISFDNDSHVANILNISSCPLTSQIFLQLYYFCCSLYLPLATFSCFVRDSNKHPFSKGFALI